MKLTEEISDQAIGEDGKIHKTEIKLSNKNSKKEGSIMTLLKLIGGFFGGIIKSKTNKHNVTILFLLAAAAAIVLDYLFFGTPVGVTLAVFTGITTTTKAGSQKTSRQRLFRAKMDSGDTYVEVPSDSLKSVKMNIKGVNDEGPFGKITIGQEMEGKLILYAGDSEVRTFAHELVANTIEACQIITNSGQTYTFSTSDNTPALEFAYEDASLVSEKDDPTLIVILITGFRDNLEIS